MANFNTFPHVDADDLNLDWLLEQYATFNDRIAEIMAHFDEVAAAMAEQNEQYKNQMLALYNNYKNYVDAKVASMNNKVDEVKDAVDQINEKTDEYVYNYLEENITEILEINPILETKYSRFGTIAANSSISINLEQNKIYDIMCLNYAFDLVKILASNNVAKIIQAPIKTTTVLENVVASETMVPDIGTVIASVTPIRSDPVILYFDSYITISVANNILTLNNTSSNVITVYDKIIFG